MVDVSTAEKILGILQEAGQELVKAGECAPQLPDDVRTAAEALFADGTETTQLVALTNVASVACGCSQSASILQAKAGGLDLRSAYKRSTRLFIQAEAAQRGVKWKVSTDPYVSNPYREAQIDEDWVARRGGRLQGASELNSVVEFVDKNPEKAWLVLLQLVELLFKKMEERLIDYRVPPRLTVPMVLQLIDRWLENGVGGNRLEILTVAVFRTVGTGLTNMWTEVTSHHINDPTSFDALCMHGSKVKAIVEVKDQAIVSSFFETLVEQAIGLGCQRCYLVTRERHIPGGMQSLDAMAANYFDFGVRIQALTIENAVRSWLALIDCDDDSLPKFVRNIIVELDERGSLEERTDFARNLRGLVGKAPGHAH